MSEQSNNPYVDAIKGKNNMNFKVEYKTLFNSSVGQLDDEVMEYLNSGWMPHGPQYYSVKDEWYVQPVLRIPSSMMAPRQ